MAYNKEISETELRKHLSGKLQSLPVFVYESIDSTNNEAKKQIVENGIKNALYISSHQSNGRGRTGHTFFSPKEGLYFSYVFTPSSLEGALHATTKAAVCTNEAIKELYNISPKIKWVNDIYLNELKICGILTEAVTSGINKGSLVVGIGINFSSTDVPDEIKNIMGFLPHNDNVDRNVLAAKIVSLLHEELENLGNNEYIKKYRLDSMLTGKDISYMENGESKTATVLDIDDEAGLVVKTPDGKTITLRNGEVFSIRPKAN